MIEKMVFAAGASDSSMEVIRCMKSIRKLGIKKCLLLQCYSPGEEASAIGGIVGEIYEENLARQKELLEEQGYECLTFIRVNIGQHKNKPYNWLICIDTY